MTKTRSRAAIAVALAAGLALSACGGGSSSADATTLNIVGFAVPEQANKAIAAEWNKTPEGKGVKFQTSYGASGDQSRAVVAGLKADYVHFSVASDVTRLVTEGLVDETWDDGPTKGVVSSSVVVLAVQKGNPKNIQGWADIVKPGVGIVTPDPGTSGSAKWNLLGAYTQALGPNGDKAAATSYLQSFVKNVVSWNDSGRTATDAFVKGTGDVLISYENEAIAARAAGVELDYVVPDTTFLIENPAAVLKDADPVTKDFLAYIEGDEGQKILGSKGFRPVDGTPGTTTGVEGANDPAKPFPAVTNLVTVADLGGWSAVNDKFFDKEKGLVTQLRGNG